MGLTPSQEANNNSLKRSSQDLSNHKSELIGTGNNSGFWFGFMVC